MPTCICLGATAYELEFGRVCIRILRPRCYFWPYRHWITKRWVFPRAVQVTIAP